MSLNQEYDSESDSDLNSLSADLDQIGKLNFNLPLNLNLSSYLNDKLNFNSLPSFDLPNVQEFSKEISKIIAYYTSNNEDGNENKERLKNSIKTAVSTRIQMKKLLSDLNLGLGISTAIERLQPLKDIVNETILLPVEDSSDFDDDYEIEKEEMTEPVGVDEVVNRDQPFFNEIVRPEVRKKKKNLVLLTEGDDTDTQMSEFDIEGLSTEEVRSLTHVDTLDDFYKEDLLREKIQTIHNLGNLSQQSKNKLVTRLMMGNYYKHINKKLRNENIKLLPDLRNQSLVFNPQTTTTKNKNSIDELVSNEVSQQEEMEESEKSESEEVILTAEDQTPSYHDPPFNSILGCSHYQRNCKLECPSCLKWFTCRFCHDNQITTHKLLRTEVKHVLCMKCNTPQVPDNNYCVECGIELANYFCSICVLYDNDTTKDIYHCDKCGICRLGLGLGKDYFHCDECNICLSIDLRERHKCLSNNTHCNCPICNEYLFTSVSKVVFMKCGHSIHQTCYDELSKHSYKCPICKKTVVNVEPQFRILDQEILQSPLPPPYDLWRCVISCNDCKGKSNVPYHVLGLKCKYCQSYNTNNLKTVKLKEDEQDDESDGSSEIDINKIRMVATNLSSNFRIDDQIYNNDDDYDGDYNKSDFDGQESDEDYNENDNIISLKRLTNSLINNLGRTNDIQSNVSFIPSILQNLINNATATSSKEESNFKDI